MVTHEQVEQKYSQIKEELASISDDVLRRFPMSDYLDAARSNRRHGRLWNFGRMRSHKRVFEKIASQHGDRAVALYLKLALCSFIQDSLEHISLENLPNEIVDLYHQWFEEVLEELSTLPVDYYDYRSLAMALDVSICSLRDIPVGGAWIVETRRVGLRPFVGGGISQFFGYLGFVILRGGGFSPYYTTHTAPRHVSYFNEREMNLTYMRIAALMKMDRRIRGLYRRSWFLDPKLEKISPRLAYLRQVPLQNGAKLFAAGATKQDAKYALAVSPTRRRLHEQGKYVPTTYALIWPREQFLEWADKTNARLNTS